MMRSAFQSVLSSTCVVGACVVGACSGSSTKSEPPRPPPIGAANEVPPDSPLAEGQYRFLYDSFGTEAITSWPPADFMLSLMKSEPDVFGDQFARFGFVHDRNDEFPVGLKRGLVDRTKLKETCALCHVAKLDDGRVWLGAPNEHLDLGRFTVEVNERWVAAGHPSAHSDLALQKLAELGPGRAQAESDSYPKVVPADYPSYFRLARRSHFNYLGTGRTVKTEAFLSIYTFGAGNPNDQSAKVPFPDDARTQAFLDFFGQLEPPQGPTQDAGLVAKGKDVFASAGCASCHHPDDPSLDDVVTLDAPTSGAPKERLPTDDPAFPRGSVATDPLHRVIQEASTSGGDTGFDDLLRFIYTHHLQTGATDGYRATPLAGLWATAPYLHDGSVATLDDLLTPPDARPRSWDHDGFTVDTTKEGSGAQGHAWGTTLSADDKRSLLAYLRSL